MAEELSFVETHNSKHMEWKIKNFLDLPRNKNYSLDSPCFSLYGANWFLRIYTNGSVIKKSVGWFSLYLRKKKSAVKYQIDMSMGIISSNSLKFAVIDGNNVVFRKSETGHGRAKFIKRSHLRISKDILIPHGTLTIFCTVRIGYRRPVQSSMESASQTSVTSAMNAESQTPSSNGVSTPIENFKDLYLSKRCADVRIIVKGREFLGHRNILTAHSTVFSAMLPGDVAEKNSDIIEITDCDPLSFEDLLLFLYTGDLAVVSISNAASLYVTATKYDIKDLKEECVRCMSSKLTTDWFCDVIHLASIYNETDILMTATNYFLENAKDILATLKWQKFLAEQPSLGNELFLKYVSKK